MARATTERIELSAIVLTTDDGREVKLTVEQARSLHTQLEALFGEKVKYLPQQPIYIERYRYPRLWEPYAPYITWCSSTANTHATISDNSAGLRVRYEGSSTGA